jgi:hypothetical protein
MPSILTLKKVQDRYRPLYSCVYIHANSGFTFDPTCGPRMDAIFTMLCNTFGLRPKMSNIMMRLHPRSGPR